MTAEERPDQVAPPVGEEIHLPGPSLVPLATAVGLTLILVGLTVNYIFTVAGGIVFVIALLRWISQVRREVSELPTEH